MAELTQHDIMSCMVWAKEHCGEDDPMDVFAWKLLDHKAKHHEKSAAFHERRQTECEVLQAGLAEKFTTDKGDGGGL